MWPNVEEMSNNDVNNLIDRVVANDETEIDLDGVDFTTLHDPYDEVLGG